MHMDLIYIFFLGFFYPRSGQEIDLADHGEICTQFMWHNLHLTICTSSRHIKMIHYVIIVGKSAHCPSVRLKYSITSMPCIQTPQTKHYFMFKLLLEGSVGRMNMLLKAISYIYRPQNIIYLCIYTMRGYDVNYLSHI